LPDGPVSFCIGGWHIEALVVGWRNLGHHIDVNATPSQEGGTSSGAYPLLASHDLSGLIKYASREPWKTRLDDCLAEHFGPATEELGIDFDELLDLVGPHWEGPLWGCAFEDLLGREIDGDNLADDYLKRRGWNETASVKAYIKALRETPMSLYEVSEVVPGQSMRLRDLLQDREPVTVQERSATRNLRNWDRIATRLIVGRSGTVISGPCWLSARGQRS
jgi:hypothetical protein